MSGKGHKQIWATCDQTVDGPGPGRNVCVHVGWEKLSLDETQGTTLMSSYIWSDFPSEKNPRLFIRGFGVAHTLELFTVVVDNP